MISSTLSAVVLSLFAVATTAVPVTTTTKDSALFFLKATVTSGNTSYNNYFGVHTGAGRDTGIVSKGPKRNGAALVLNNGTYIGIPLEYTDPDGSVHRNYEYLNLDTSRPMSYHPGGKFTKAAPKGYFMTEFFTGTETPGFSLVEQSSGRKQLEYNGTDRPKFATFAICFVENAALTYVGNTTELLWRTSDASPDTTGNCADVTLSVVPYS